MLSQNILKSALRIAAATRSLRGEAVRQTCRAIAVTPLALACCLATSAGCERDSNSQESAGAASASIAKSPDMSAAQVATGRDLYREKCTSCHGERGEGNATVNPPAPSIAGPGALPVDPLPGTTRKKQFLSATNLQKYISMRMPPAEAGRLADDQTWALSAYVLTLNGVDSGGRMLSAAVASSIPLHAPSP